MSRLVETGLGIVFVGGLLAAKFGVPDNVAALVQADPGQEQGYMGDSNPWSKDYVAPPPGRAPVYFRNCDAARAAGAAPVRRGEAGYASHLDRDGDGIGCEPYRGR